MALFGGNKNRRNKDFSDQWYEDDFEFESDYFDDDEELEDYYDDYEEDGYDDYDEYYEETAYSPVKNKKAPRQPRRKNKRLESDFAWQQYKQSKQVNSAQFSSDAYISREEKRRSRAWIRGLARFFVIVAVIAVGSYVSFKLWVKPPEISKLNAPIVFGADGQAVVDEPAPVDGVAPEGSTAANRRANTYTFAIVGKDVMGSHTDSIILGMFDINEKKLNFVTIPRDTMINTAWEIKKINNVYPASVNTGKDATANLLEAIADLLGYPVDCYAIVDVQAAEKLVDAIGGVYFDVPCDMDWDAPDQTTPLHIHIKKGYQLLSGADAVNVFRFRYSNDGSNSYARGDIDRIEVQHDLLMAIMKQLLNVGNIPNFAKAIEIYQQNVETNLSAANIAYFGQEFLKVGFDSINFMTMPNTPDGWLFGLSYVFPDIDGWIEMVNEYFNPFTVPITKANVDMLSFDGVDFVTTQGKIRGGRYSFYGANG